MKGVHWETNRPLLEADTPVKQENLRSGTVLTLGINTRGESTSCQNKQ